jgi:predicted HNH restriction endonuclease
MRTKALLKWQSLSSLTRKGKSNYTESELILPALQFIHTKKATVETSDLIQYLQSYLKPKGHDAQLISGRKDTYFSQKVRNLKSHDSLTKLGLATYSKRKWKITEKGQQFLIDNEIAVNNLLEQGFQPRVIGRKDEYDYSKMVIEEGITTSHETTSRKRSNKLKLIAVAEFKKGNRGEVYCTVCTFDFGKSYGKHGRGFIEIHHNEPIHEKDIRGEKTAVKIALTKVSLVCSNCHRMIHRKRGQMLSIAALRTIVVNHKC